MLPAPCQPVMVPMAPGQGAGGKRSPEQASTLSHLLMALQLPRLPLPSVKLWRLALALLLNLRFACCKLPFRSGQLQSRALDGIAPVASNAKAVIAGCALAPRTLTRPGHPPEPLGH